MGYAVLDTLKTLHKDYHLHAPGYVAHTIEGALPTIAGRAEKSDWRRRLRDLIPLEFKPMAGRMWFPVAFQATGTPRPHGTIVTVEVVSLGFPHKQFDEGPGARVRSWLSNTLSDVLHLAQPEVAQCLADITLTCRIGANRSAPDANTSSPVLEGESMDLAIALAIVGHLIGRAPHGAWIVSGALGDYGDATGIDMIPKKRAAIAVEAPNVPTSNIRLLDAPQSFIELARAVYGHDVIAELGLALGQSAVTSMDQALVAWRRGDETAAARHARVALTLRPTVGQAALAHLILGAEAIHRGDSAHAAEHLAKCGAQAPAATAQDGWSSEQTSELTIRLAVLAMDRLQLAEALTLVDGAVAAVDRVPPEYRGHSWYALAAQAHGTRSTIVAANGALDEAIGERQLSLELGPRSERARSCIELAKLLFRNHQTADAEPMLREAKESLHQMPRDSARPLTARFLAIAAARHRVEVPTEAAIQHALATPPLLHRWPEPAECIETLIAQDNETLALSWFEQHVFNTTETHPAYLLFFVTSAARAVARGFTDARWRSGAMPIVMRLRELKADASLVDVLEAFCHGGAPEPVLRRAIY